MKKYTCNLCGITFKHDPYGRGYRHTWTSSLPDKTSVSSRVCSPCKQWLFQLYLVLDNLEPCLLRVY